MPAYSRMTMEVFVAGQYHIRLGGDGGREDAIVIRVPANSLGQFSGLNDSGSSTVCLHDRQIVGIEAELGAKLFIKYIQKNRGSEKLM